MCSTGGGTVIKVLWQEVTLELAYRGEWEDRSGDWLVGMCMCVGEHGMPKDEAEE